MAEQDRGRASKTFPYAERFGVTRAIPDKGRPRAELVAELRQMAAEEDVFWQTGKPPPGVWLPDQDVKLYRGRG